MKVSRILLAGLAGVAIGYAVKRFLNRKAIASVMNDILFDAEFLPGTGKINQIIPDNPEMRNWFKTRQTTVHETDEALFI